nr:unnamed protein product [Gallus gallus]
MARRPRHR